VNPTTNRIYVANYYSDNVSVIQDFPAPPETYTPTPTEPFTPTPTDTFTPTPTRTPTPTTHPVGGIADLPDVAGGAAAASTQPGGASSLPYAAIAGASAAVLIVLGAGAWYARRRWLSR